MLRQVRIEPGRNGIAGARRLCSQLFEPLQGIELLFHQLGASLLLGSGTRVFRLVYLDLLCFREAIHTARGNELVQCWLLVPAAIDLRPVGQHQARGAEPVLPARRGGQGIPDPRNRATRGPDIGMVTFNLQIPFPRRFRVRALHQGAHEGEVADVQFSRLINVCIFVYGLF